MWLAGRIRKVYWVNVFWITQLFLYQGLHHLGVPHRKPSMTVVEHYICYLCTLSRRLDMQNELFEFFV